MIDLGVGWVEQSVTHRLPSFGGLRPPYDWIPAFAGMTNGNPYVSTDAYVIW